MYREFKYFLSKEINVSELKIILNFADKALPQDSTKVHVSVANVCGNQCVAGQDEG